MTQSLAQLLVHLDASPQALRRLEAACLLGRAHHAAVTALYAVTPSFVDMPFSPEIGPDMATALRELDDAQQARALAAFNQCPLVFEVQATWVAVCDEPVASAFAEQAFYADILVLGQDDPASASSVGIPHDFVETVLVASGKPALILPYTEAAVSAERLDLNSYLRLHGVSASWHREGEEPEALGELLLSRALDLNAGLLVMGCYGHSRAREWLLGGISRTVLRSMTLPVLMMH